MRLVRYHGDEGKSVHWDNDEEISGVNRAWKNCNTDIAAPVDSGLVLDVLMSVGTKLEGDSVVLDEGTLLYYDDGDDGGMPVLDHG